MVEKSCSLLRNSTPFAWRGCEPFPSPSGVAIWVQRRPCAGVDPHWCIDGCAGQQPASTKVHPRASRTTCSWRTLHCVSGLRTMGRANDHQALAMVFTHVLGNIKGTVARRPLAFGSGGRQQSKDARATATTVRDTQSSFSDLRGCCYPTANPRSLPPSYGHPSPRGSCCPLGRAQPLRSAP